MADFLAGYLSGVAGIIIGSPLDIIKTRTQSQVLPTGISSWYQSPSSLLRGTAAPILTQGALNALLFYSYNRSLALLGSPDPQLGGDPPLWKVFTAGAISGLACFVVTTPTEVVKCRAQVAGTDRSSLAVAREVYREYGLLRGFYLGGGVTGVRDAVGYGFYFWAYEGAKWYFPIDGGGVAGGSWRPEINTLLCGGVAGCVGWATVYPLDVVKTMVQVQAVGGGEDVRQALLERPVTAGDEEGTGRRGRGRRTVGGWECAKRAYRDGGVRVFWQGIWVCLGRAFLVNAVTFFTYEWAMRKLVCV